MHLNIQFGDTPMTLLTNCDRMALRVAGSYAAVGTFYILISDTLLMGTVSTFATYSQWQTYKGIGFVLLTSAVLWLVLRTIWAKQTRALRAALLAEDRLRMALTAAGGAVWSVQMAPDGSFAFTVVGGLAQTLGLDPDHPIAFATFRHQLHPLDVGEFDRHANLIASGGPIIPDLTCRIRSRDGTYRWIKLAPETASMNRSQPGALSGLAFDVTDLQQAARDLIEVVAGAELGTWRFDLRTGQIQINDRWASLIGYTRAELEPVTQATWKRLCHPDDIARMEADEVATIQAGDYFFSHELRMRHKDGHWVWILSRRRVVEVTQDGLAAVVTGVHVDISRRKALETELQTEGDFLRRLMDTSMSGILGVDETGRLVFANHEAESILGLTTAQMIERPHNDPFWQAKTLDGADLAQSQYPLARIIKSRTELRDLRLRFRHASGAERILSVNVAPLQVQTGPVHAVCAITDITDRLNTEVTLARAAAEAQYAALHDPMTGLPNRQLFEDHLRQAIRHADRDGTLLMQVFIDIDNFKLVNDRFGHQMGDRLICQVANRLDGLLCGAQVLARVAGDEFALLQPLPDQDRVAALMDPLAQALAAPFDLDGNTVYLTASMGISVYPVDATTVDEVWLNSDIAMYEAKASGRNQYIQFSAKIRDRLADEARIVQLLQHALREGQFALVLQPKVALPPPQRVIGAEALIRFTDPDLAAISPAVFIPIAERTGLIRQIDIMVINLLGPFLATLAAKGLHLRVSANLSPESLRQAGFGTTLLAALTKARLDRDDILFELTEGAIMDSSANVRENIALLLAQGFELSADDFGTGYSSLAYLHQLHLTELKIDRSFIMRLGLAEGASDPIVLAILAMAQTFGLRTVAEGVETADQMRWLQSQGCDVGQGYYFGKGCSPDEFVADHLARGQPPLPSQPSDPQDQSDHSGQ